MTHEIGRPWRVKLITAVISLALNNEHSKGQKSFDCVYNVYLLDFHW